VQNYVPIRSRVSSHYTCELAYPVLTRWYFGFFVSL